ncbi:DUF4401 domain-containing protein [Psychrobacter sp. I-STPA6b]|uniref:DUF4401 domain-containing protein n=1 Tax=Psychrobacter sp. I-STPA6b TaxID=2585718 RepID=UPI001D0C60B0|nr:DUF4401 domain-containing protein [Psychrobacter sp. I-STPA6b]
MMINRSQISQNTPQITHTEMPWYVSSLMLLSGLISGFFLISIFSILLAGMLHSFGILISFAIAMTAISFWLFRYSDRITLHHIQIFISSLGFSIGMAGLVYWFLSINELLLTASQTAGILLLIQILLTLIMPNFIYRLISSLLGIGCLLFLLYQYHALEVSLGLLALFASICSLQSDELISYLPNKYQPYAKRLNHVLTYAITFALLTISAYFIVSEQTLYALYGFDDVNPFAQTLVKQGLLIVASLYASWLILRRYGISLLSHTGLLISTAVIIIGLLSLYVSGLLATCLVIVMAFANKQRVLLGLAIFALVSYIFWYYYQLDSSLLVKSGSMLIIGLALLLLRWYLLRRYVLHQYLPLHHTANTHLTTKKNKGKQQ